MDPQLLTHEDNGETAEKQPLTKVQRIKNSYACLKIKLENKLSDKVTLSLYFLNISLILSVLCIIFNLWISEVYRKKGDSFECEDQRNNITEILEDPNKTQIEYESLLGAILLECPSPRQLCSLMYLLEQITRVLICLYALSRAFYIRYSDSSHYSSKPFAYPRFLLSVLEVLVGILNIIGEDTPDKELIAIATSLSFISTISELYYSVKENDLFLRKIHGTILSKRRSLMVHLNLKQLRGVINIILPFITILLLPIHPSFDQIILKSNNNYTKEIPHKTTIDVFKIENYTWCFLLIFCLLIAFPTKNLKKSKYWSLAFAYITLLLLDFFMFRTINATSVIFELVSFYIFLYFCSKWLTKRIYTKKTPSSNFPHLYFGGGFVISLPQKTKDIQYKELFYNVPNFLEENYPQYVKVSTDNEKDLIFKKFDPRNLKEYEKEADIIRYISHDSIVHFQYVVKSEDNNPIGLLISPMEINITFRDEIIKESGRNTITSAMKLQWIYSITSALNYLHGVKLVHHNMNLSSIMFCEGKCAVKLHNFENAGDIGSPIEKELKRPTDKEFQFQDPESIWVNGDGEPKLLSTESDVYGLGLIIFAILFRCQPFGEAEFATSSEYRKWLSEESPKISGTYGPNSVLYPAFQYMKKCIEKDPKLRPNYIIIEGYLRERINKKTIIKDFAQQE